MISLYNIWTISRYEMKTLLRSWFFRIFAGLSLFILFWMDLAFMTVGDIPLTLRGLAGSVPYYNILFLNTAQAIIAVFLASDFLKRDKKLDTTEVIYMRSMTNGDYVLGKTLGIFIVFITLNFLLLIIAAIFNVISKDMDLFLPAYLYYPLLISVPTLIFIFGLSFVFMALIRNQPVTFIVLLGYIALTLFYLGNKLHHVFDYMAFNVPMMHSDIVGFGHLDGILIHRGMYVLLGLGCIFATIRLLKRLPQSRAMQGLSLILMIVFLGGGFGLGGIFLRRIGSEKQLRRDIVALNDRLADVPRVTMLEETIDLIHSENSISCEATLVFENRDNASVDRYLFRLNPGLIVESVKGLNGEVTFEQDLHLVIVKPSRPLEIGVKDSIRISYGGRIDERACYLDADPELWDTAYRVWVYHMDKRHAFITPDYVLLTPESGWYPVSGISYSTKRPLSGIRDFVRFRMHVQTSPHLTVVSQGAAESEGAGSFSFRPEFPLPHVSLAIGDYESRSIVVDSLTYALATIKGHDYFTPYFDQIGDTMSVLLQNIKLDFENEIEMFYPFKRLTLVEVPLQFVSYPRIWTEARETVQPEMVLLPEMGMMIPGLDFKQAKRREERRMERSNMVITDVEKQSRMLQRFVRMTITEDMTMGRGDDDEELPSIKDSYVIHPNYFTFVNSLSSERWPLLNMALEAYISKRMESPMSTFRRMFSGLTDEEKVNLLLIEQNLDEIIRDPDKKDMIRNVLQTKGRYLFTGLEAEIGSDAFAAFLNELLEKTRYKGTTGEVFSRLLNDRFGIDFESWMESWSTSRDLPALLLGPVDAYKVLDGDRTRYQIKFSVTNTENVAGLMKVSFRLGGFGGRGGFSGMRPGGGDDDDVERLIRVEAQQSKEVGFVLDGQPRMMMLDMFVAKNLPLTANEMFEEMELKRGVQPFDGERILAEPFMSDDPDAIIVDNEDAGFQFENIEVQSPLKKLLNIRHESEYQYEGVNFWRPSVDWKATTHSDFYGTYIRSAYYIRSGDGDKKVSWTTEIPDVGYYDIYVYNVQIRSRFGRGRGGGRGSGRDASQWGQYHYIVHHDEGVDEAVVDRNNAETGWYFLGTYYLSGENAQVELTNESDERVVYADAVKWVKH